MMALKQAIAQDSYTEHYILGISAGRPSEYLPKLVSVIGLLPWGWHEVGQELRVHKRCPFMIGEIRDPLYEY